ncbi:MAG TPA: hypothetical protein PLM83_08695, partial [Bacillota bacterium]|nr:hypothetical protein [Bacillota bacterium]
MKSSSEFHQFAAYLLGQKKLREVDKAVACIWFAGYHGHAEEMSAKAVADCMAAVGLSGNVNISRLWKALTKSKFTVKGTNSNAFRISPVKKHLLDEQYEPLLKQRKVKVSDSLLPDAVIQDTRKYLQDLARQINGTYDAAYYDACAVLCRRLTESLLIEGFQAAGQLTAIQRPDGTLEMLDSILAKAKSGQFIRLPRGTPDTLDKIKRIGDTAAHDRFH